MSLWARPRRGVSRRGCARRESLAELGPRAVRAPRPAAAVVYQDTCRQTTGRASRPSHKRFWPASGSRAGRDRAAGHVLRLGRCVQPHPAGGGEGAWPAQGPLDHRGRAQRDRHTNPGCALQLAASLRQLGHGRIPIVHPTKLLADALREYGEYLVAVTDTALLCAPVRNRAPTARHAGESGSSETDGR